MDLKALMQKLETINTKQIVTESVETKKVITESVAEPVRKSADPVFKGSIARSLAEEFGYDLDERVTINPDGTTSGGIAPAPAAAPAASASPWANDPAKDAAWKALSPEDQKWLGGADPTDPYILARAPNKGKPGATAPGAGTKPAATPAAAPTGTTAQGDDEGNTLITKPDGTTQVVGPDGKPLPNGGRVDPAGGAATKPAADPAVAATREKFKALMDKLEKTGGVSGAAPAPAAPKKPTQIAPAPKPATGAATKPAAGNSVDWNAIGAGQMTAESNYADDQTLLAIKNIRY